MNDRTSDIEHPGEFFRQQKPGLCAPRWLLLAAVSFLASAMLWAEDPSLILQDGFETLEAGSALPTNGSESEWSTPDGRPVTAVVVNSGTAPEGQQFLQVVATGDQVPDDHAEFLKIDPGAREGSISKKMDVDPAELEGKTLRFSARARGRGFVCFYFYQALNVGGGLPNNPRSEALPVDGGWQELEWTYPVSFVPETEKLLAAIHFFTSDDAGIELDDVRVEVMKP